MKRIYGLIALLALTSCAGTETKSASELHSDLRSALSLASETNLLIAQIEAGRLLPHFQREHANYLRKEALRQAKEVRDSGNGATDSNKVALCAEQLDILSRELGSIATSSDRDTLVKADNEVENIRKKLINVGAGR